MVPGYGFQIITILFLFVCVKSQTFHVDEVLISRGKHVTMSSTLDWMHIWSATFAVDGNMRRDANTCKCCASTNTGSDETFTLDLEKSYKLSRIKILGRTDDQTGEISGLEVYVRSTANIQGGGLIRKLTNTTEEVIQVTTSAEYQYVIVKSTIAKPNYVLICEIQVYTRECQNSFYDDCIKIIGHCHGNDVCNKTTGICPNECKHACSDGFYGDCSKPCGNCKTVSGCNKTNGHCSNGCEAGFEGVLCNRECKNGVFGENCNSVCHCANDAACDKGNGACSNGQCDIGYTGISCSTECKNGWFGDGCKSTCGHCFTDVTCNITTGFCAGGCASGYNGTFCNASCPDGSYGPGCNNNCGACKDNGVCDRFNGNCKLECDAGFKGVDCKTECQHGTFGEDCISVCHCANNAPCDKGNGTCSKGQCDFGYTGFSCSKDLNIIANYNTTVNMSSIWNDGSTNWGPELAIDNNFKTNPDTCLCCSATRGEPNSWWEIEFEDVIPIMNIQIYGRQPELKQLKDAQIFFSNDTSLGFPDPFTSIVSVTSNCFNVTLPNTLLKAIRVVRPTGILMLCEVKVYMGECKVGRFGRWCAHKCNCYDNMTCDFTSGKCQTPACKDGWRGPACDQESSHAQYGQNCTNKIHCYKNASCNHVTGICENDRCAPGRKGPTCSEECQHGTFGENCNSVCHCANNGSCDKASGACSNGQCDFGYTGNSCNTDLNIIADYNTTVNMSSTWNDWGPELAIDNNAGPNVDTCHCCSATQGEPNSWWEIEFEDVIPIMNIQIYGRQPESILINDAQIYLDLSDPFTTIILLSTNNYYNFTLPNTLLKAIRVVRPTGVLTLCEVKVYMGECKVGRFGGWCAQKCNCYDNMTCEFTSGKCQTPACKDGWRGPACDQAVVAPPVDLSNVPVGSIVGAVAGVILLAILVVNVVFLRKRSKSKNKTDTPVPNTPSNYDALQFDNTGGESTYTELNVIS